MTYEVEGFIDTGAVQGLLVMAVVLGAVALVMVLVPILAGQAYEQGEASIDSISDENVKAKVKSTALSGFDALDSFGGYLPLFVLAIIMISIIGLVISGFLGRSNVAM